MRKFTAFFPLTFRECSCQNQRIGNRNGNQNSEMEQVHFRGKVRIIRKGAKRVEDGMDEDARKQAAAAIKDRDQQEADCDRKDNLAQVTHKIHAAAVEQVDDMSDAEGDTGNDNGRFNIVLCDGHKQKTTEDHFLQKSNAEHTHDAADRFRC
mgnify:CR=1 FL=1